MALSSLVARVASAAAALTTMAVAATGCVGPGLLTDGTSVSFGTTSTGALRNASRLSPRGEGYHIPSRWLQRQRNYGTDELVALLIHTARRVQAEHRKTLLEIADLSPQAGGATKEHKSHRSGRDADLLLFYSDDAGQPMQAGEMLKLDREGQVLPPTSQPTSRPVGTMAALPATPATATMVQLPAAAAALPQEPVKRPAQFDVPRTWSLVKALVTDPGTSVQWIFIGRPLIRLLLRHARAKKEPDVIIARAAAVLRHSPGHMDHLHVRIFCAPSDRALGCMDRGPSRWLKKEIKYLDTPPAPLPMDTRELWAALRLRPTLLLGQ